MGCESQLATSSCMPLNKVLKPQCLSFLLSEMGIIQRIVEKIKLIFIKH